MSASDHLNGQQFREQHYPAHMPVEAIIPHLKSHADGSPLVDQYAADMKSGKWEWDRKYENPISLGGHAGDIDGVSDGTHRTLAAAKAGLSEVPVSWHEESWARVPNLRGTGYENPSSSPTAERIHRLRSSS